MQRDANKDYRSALAAWLSHARKFGTGGNGPTPPPPTPPQPTPGTQGGFGGNSGAGQTEGNSVSKPPAKWQTKADA